ncbi:MAG: hypothetical protein ACXVNM_02860 [Bacteroidia bacterium]
MRQKNNQNKKDPVPLSINYKGNTLKGEAIPLSTSCAEGVCFELDVTLNNDHLGTIYCGSDMHWIMKNMADQDLVNKIGEEIQLWYG